MEKMTIAEKLKTLQFINIGGCQYLGKKEKVKDVVTISNAVPVNDTFDDTIKDWIRKDNLNQLEEIVEEGMVTVSSKNFTEEQKMIIDIIAAQAEHAIKYAVKNLENNSF